MHSKKEIRVGLAGAGYVSAYHIRALRTLPQVKIIGLADLDQTRARGLAAKFDIPLVCGSLEEMRPARPDVIHVLTPPSSHYRLALEALGMGCHVFVEKPMAPTTRECDLMIAAAERAGRVLSVNHSARMDPVVERGLELVHRGALGKVLSVDIFRGSDYPLYAGGPLPPQFGKGGYPFEDMGVHALYLVEAFLGKIRGVDVRYRSTGNDPNVYFDDWRGDVECENGAGRIHLSWSARPMRNEIHVTGTRGFLQLDCFLQTCTLHKSLPGPKAIQASVSAVMNSLATLYKVPRNMLQFVTGKLRPSPGIHAGVLQFHDALLRGAPPPVSVEEGRRVVSWVEDVCRRADADRERAFRVAGTVPPARVLVTGASGFLGRALLKRLRGEGEVVRVLARRPSAQLESEPGVQVVYGDLGDPEAVDRAISGVELVYHLGATMKGRGWPEFEGGTVRGTANVVQSCLRHGVRRLIYVSSVTVLDYASQKAGARVTEQAPLEPYPAQRGAYTQAKLQAERLVMDAVRESHLPAVIVRPGQIFGPGAESVPPYGTIALAGRWVVIGSGKLRLPLVYVEDVVDGLIAAAQRPSVIGSIFHLVDEAPATQDEYVEMCRKVAGERLRSMHASRYLLYVAGAALEVVGRLVRRNVPLSRYRVRSIKELSFDCSAAREKLGWKPVVGVRVGFRETFEQRDVQDALATSG
jgi:predicted dehydrogenase/nucleoside-diphosphate-sugar epimerase